MAPGNATVSTQLRERLAHLLGEHTAAISRLWRDAASSDVPVSPGYDPASLEADAPVPAALVALLQRIRQDDPTVRTQYLRSLMPNWYAAGLTAQVATHYVDWLQAAADTTVRELGLPPEDEGALLDALAVELIALRLDTAAVANAALHERCEALQEQLSALVEHAPGPLLAVDLAHGHIHTVNLAASHLLAYPPDKLQTLALPDICPSLAETAFRQFIAELVDAGSASRKQVELVRSDASVVRAHLQAHLLGIGNRPLALCLLEGLQGQTAAGTPVVEHGQPSASTAAADPEQLEGLQSFLENVTAALPVGLLVLDADLRILHANPPYYVQRGLAREEVIGHPVQEVMSAVMLEQAGLRAAMLSVLETGERVRWSGYRDSSRQGERVLNIRLDPCEGLGGAVAILVTLEDITERQSQLFERTILQQIAHALLGELELHKLLHVILTSMTAGGAVGLGFNRAVLLLVDEEATELRAEMAVGPEDLDQAIEIWEELSADHHTLQDFLADYDQLPAQNAQPLQGVGGETAFPLTDTDRLPMSAVVAHETVHVVDAEIDGRVSPQLQEMLGTNEFVVAPLVAREKVIGAAIADNRFSQEPISQGAVQLLTALADQAAMAIDTARAYQRAKEQAARLDKALHELQAAEEERVRNAKLAAIGEVTAIVAHEIRNPLSTIGGFARSIVREPERAQRNARNAQIIVEEVARLEQILGGLMDFSKPGEPELVMTDLGPIVASVAEQAREAEGREDMRFKLAIGADLPQVLADERHVRQILVNLVNNAADAMGDGGTLTLGLKDEGHVVEMFVTDTGEGMPKERLERVFDAFYTSKPTGTGLGLALCRKLVAQHGAEMKVVSEVGKGSTFTVQFPVPGAPAVGEPEEGFRDEGD